MSKKFKIDAKVVVVVFIVGLILNIGLLKTDLIEQKTQYEETVQKSQDELDKVKKELETIQKNTEEYRSLNETEKKIVDQAIADAKKATEEEKQKKIAEEEAKKKAEEEEKQKKIAEEEDLENKYKGILIKGEKFIDIKSGSGNNYIGKRGQVYFNPDLITEESLINYYNDYIKPKNALNYYTMININDNSKGFTLWHHSIVFNYGDIDGTGSITNSYKVFEILNDSIQEIQ